MTKEIKLFAPNGLPILGMRAADGSVRGFLYSYDSSTTSSHYELAEGAALADGPSVLVDSEGNGWKPEDVEWFTLFERR
jgi:hypothetical protein